jgi:Glycosyl transferase family 2
MRFSILIGRVSTQDRARVLETLAALRAQLDPPPFEVIIADRLQDEVSERIRTEHPEVRLIACAPEITLPELRTIALDHAVGEVIVVTEDHCVPTAQWLAAMERTLADAHESTVAVGGCVANGVRDTGLDWATFLCEYSAFSEPVAEGEVGNLPGMNVAYRAAALAGVEREALLSGFWETTVHPRLRAAGGRFVSTNAIELDHAKKFSVGLFAQQRFIYSRYYAGLRFERDQRIRRALACCLTPLLPPLLLARIARNASARPALRRPFVRALPHLVVFVLIWAAGEMAGYAFGAGDALARIE